ncbi:MAG: Gfo/Idh/MocA family oxidoreductase [Candidatus Symbiothrix sp.]|jgi:predicted dehydrogenase|nr:Gfo/Idh/MocA family oxidoreductase [Candidatus Symbiothrix sp.]
MNRIKFAVVGYGHIGKRHAEMISRNSDAELVGLCDIDPLAITRRGEPLRSPNPSQLPNYQLSAIPFHSSIDELLQKTDADVVNICTPNGFHAAYAVKALEAGKHVVIEKPMALTTLDAEQVIEASKKVNKHIFCVMQNRYSPPSVWIKDLVASGKLGQIYMVQLNCYWNRDARYYKQGNWHGTADLDGGTLFTQFSHFIDILYWLFGDITNIQTRFNDFNHSDLTAFEDSGIVNFDFVNGGMGCLNYSTAVWDKNLESSLTLIAENGSVKIGGQYMNEVKQCHVKDYEMPNLAPTNPGNDYGAYKGSAQNHHFVIENVINVLNGKAEITATAQEGLKVVEIIENIYKLK